MTVALTINGATFNYPENGDVDWGGAATSWASAVTSGMLQKSGGIFTLLADVNFGPNFGLLSQYFTTRSANPASAGVVRLANTDAIAFRNAANDNNLLLNVSGDNLQFNGTNVIISGLITNADVASNAAIAFSKLEALPSANVIVGSATNVPTAVALTGDIAISDAGVTSIASGVIVNADVNASAAIAYSKLSLTNSIVNADINASALIDYGKLASLPSTQILVGSSGNVATPRAVTGDITISNTGVVGIASGVIVNADVNASAAIAGSKISPVFGAQSISGDSGLDLLEISTPSTPTTGRWKVYPKTDGIYRLDDAASELRLVTTADIAGITTESVHTVTNADYTITNGDGFTTILFATGASDRTVTLPAAASNTDRVIRIVKISGGITNQVNITGFTEIAVNVSNPTTFQSDGTTWRVVSGAYNYFETIRSVNTGTFTSGTIRLVRNGRVVSAQVGVCNHTSSASPTSDTTIIGTGFRPAVQHTVCVLALNGIVITFDCLTTGAVRFSYINNAGSAVNRTDSGNSFTTSWLIDNP